MKLIKTTNQPKSVRHHAVLRFITDKALATFNNNPLQFLRNNPNCFHHTGKAIA